MADSDKRGEAAASNPFDGNGLTAGLNSVDRAEIQRLVDAEITERETQTRGRWCTRIGIVSAITTLALAIGWEATFSEDMPLAAVIPMYFLGFLAAGVGLHERITRSDRATQQGILRQLFANERGMFLLAELLPEGLDNRWYRGYVLGAKDGMGVEPADADATEPRVNVGGDVIKFRQRTGSAAGA